VMTSSVVAGNTVSSNPTLTVQPFFSGVALDVTPQIDDAGNITLHVHPSVSTVTTVDKPLDLGNAGKYNLPLASSAVSETDSIVRGQDGRIVAIGGLIRQTTTSKNSQMPGAGDLPVFGSLFKNTSKSMQRRELVILIKPTIVQNDKTWSDDILKSQRRMQALESGSTIDW
jgi:MSHA biogenesis protein MshL